MYTSFGILVLLIIGVFFTGCTGGQSAQTGTLQLTSSPEGAEIYLDSQYRGTTPSTIPDVALGAHTLEFRKAGYVSYSMAISVPSGPSQYSAALSPATGTGQTGGGDVSGTKTSGSVSAAKITVQVSKDPVIVGDSITFSGIGPGMSEIKLTVFGPGIYTNGVVIKTVKANTAGLWTFTWNPGTSLRSGQYAIVASDPQDTVSDRVAFQVIGGGYVTVAMINHAVASGDVVRFSGRCTSGAPMVRLVLSGPGPFSGGIDLGTASVLGDKTWSFKYTLDSKMPTGIYTIMVYDVPKTTSATDQFTVGYA
jgi:hypothetical protein